MILDITVVCYCCFGIIRGRRRRLSEMIYRLVRMLIALFAGISLFKFIGGVLSKITGSLFSESLGFLMAFILPLGVLRLFRRALSRWIESRIGQINEPKWGMMIGFVHSFFVTAALLIPLSLSQSSYIYRLFSKGSLALQSFTFIVKLFNP